jgi:hypothetical protein
MVSRFAVSISVVSVASLFALWSACKSDPDFKAPPTTMAPDAREFHDAREYLDAKVYEDAHEFHDAHVYMDAHEFHDAHVFMDAPIPRSCMNHPDPVMMGSGAAETETLIVTFDCGSYAAGVATPTMIDGSGTKTVLPPFNFQCGNNVMTFNTQVTLTVYEITGVAFDIFCN